MPAYFWISVNCAGAACTHVYPTYYFIEFDIKWSTLVLKKISVLEEQDMLTDENLKSFWGGAYLCFLLVCRKECATYCYTCIQLHYIQRKIFFRPSFFLYSPYHYMRAWIRVLDAPSCYERAARVEKVRVLRLRIGQNCRVIVYTRHCSC